MQNLKFTIIIAVIFFLQQHQLLALSHAHTNNINNDNRNNNIQPTELLQIQIISRHCDRTCTHYNYNLPNDPINWFSYFQMESGQLTELGQYQCRQLGNFLFLKYFKNLQLMNSFNETLMYFRSTNIDRTLMSVFSISLGLFNNDNNFNNVVYNDNFVKDKFKAVPIHSVALEDDVLLHGYEICNLIKTKKENIKSSEVYQQYFIKNQNFIQQLYNVTGWKETNDKIHILFDLLTVQQAHQLIHLNWVLENFSLIEKLRDDYNNLFYNYNVIGREGCSYLNGEILRNMDLMLGKKNEKRYIHFSAHDTTIQSVAASLKLENSYSFITGHPKYGSTLIFELYKMSDQSNAVRIVYNNGYNDTSFQPLILKDLGCNQEYCPFTTFENLIKTYSMIGNDNSWCEACGDGKIELDNNDKNNNNGAPSVCVKDRFGKVEEKLHTLSTVTIVLASANVVMFLVLVLLIVYCWVKRKKLDGRSGHIQLD
ncbi:hypothetical protein ABK040_010452 [Willaertia magna]